MTTAAIGATVEPVIAGRRRPLLTAARTPGFWVPATVLVVILAIAAFPQLFAGLFGHGDPRVCDLGRSGDGAAAGPGWNDRRVAPPARPVIAAGCGKPRTAASEPRHRGSDAAFALRGSLKGPLRHVPLTGTAIDSAGTS